MDYQQHLKTLINTTINMLSHLAAYYNCTIVKATKFNPDKELRVLINKVSPLHLALLVVNLEKANEILEHNASNYASLIEEEYRVPLLPLACRHYSIEMIKKLIAYGADPFLEHANSKIIHYEPRTIISMCSIKKVKYGLAREYDSIVDIYSALWLNDKHPKDTFEHFDTFFLELVELLHNINYQYVIDNILVILGVACESTTVLRHIMQKYSIEPSLDILYKAIDSKNEDSIILIIDMLKQEDIETCTKPLLKLCIVLNNFDIVHKLLAKNVNLFLSNPLLASLYQYSFDFYNDRAKADQHKLIQIYVYKCMIEKPQFRNYIATDGCSLLMYSYENFELFVLLQEYIDIFTTFDRDNCSIVHHIIGSYAIDDAKTTLHFIIEKSNYDLQWSEEKNKSVLSRISYTLDEEKLLEVTELLLRCKVSIIVEPSFVQSINNVKQLQMLLDHGLNVNVSSSYNALRCAIERYAHNKTSNNLEIIALLLKYGADPTFLQDKSNVRCVTNIFTSHSASHSATQTVPKFEIPKYLYMYILEPFIENDNRKIIEYGLQALKKQKTFFLENDYALQWLQEQLTKLGKTIDYFN